jgi:hypothetical protein
MNRLLRRLREPLRPKPDDVDWDRLGRTWSRLIGGSRTPPSDPSSPAIRAWNRGAERAIPGVPPMPRWKKLSAVAAALAIDAALFAGLYLIVRH